MKCPSNAACKAILEAEIAGSNLSEPRRARTPSRLTQSAQDALRNFDAMPNSAYIRLPVLVTILGLSPATVWRHVKAGLICRPRKFGRSTAWNVGEIRKLLEGDTCDANNAASRAH